MNATFSTTVLGFLAEAMLMLWLVVMGGERTTIEGAGRS
jgi:hypothetical protein